MTHCLTLETLRERLRSLPDEHRELALLTEALLLRLGTLALESRRQIGPALDWIGDPFSDEHLVEIRAPEPGVVDLI